MSAGLGFTRTVAQISPCQFTAFDRPFWAHYSRSNCRTANTCANLLKVWSALCGFITHLGVEPTNDADEQALRGILLKRKTSGPTRSRRRDDFLACRFTAYETCRRQGRDLIDYLHGAVVAWINKTALPSLIPQPKG